MQIEVLKFKTHRFTATEAANLIEGEKTRVVNVPTARKVQKGDIVVILSYAGMDVEEAKKFRAPLIFPNKQYNTLN